MKEEPEKSLGHGRTPQATVPAAGKGASSAAQSPSLTFTETRRLPAAARKTSQNTFVKRCAVRLWDSQCGTVLDFSTVF